MQRPRFLPDNFTLGIITAVILASIFPCKGNVAAIFEAVTDVAIALLFFLHGAKLSSQAVRAGITHWRLHLVVFLSTFVVFPLLGLLLKPVFVWLTSPQLYIGLLFLCTLPSTVQSSIAFTAVARGNVPAAICSATASNLLGIFITPLMVGLIVVQHHGVNNSALDSILKIILQLLLPFIAGQIARRWIGKWLAQHSAIVRCVDQGSILLVIYTAFSAAIIEGLWHQLPPAALLGLVIACALLLAIVLFLTTYGSRILGFNTEDEITIVFCGSKKSLASGVPIANILFSASTAGAMVLPLMIFHQIQLMVCAIIARRYAQRKESVQTITRH